MNSINLNLQNYSFYSFLHSKRNLTYFAIFSIGGIITWKGVRSFIKYYKAQKALETYTKSLQVFKNQQKSIEDSSSEEPSEEESSIKSASLQNMQDHEEEAGFEISSEGLYFTDEVPEEGFSFTTTKQEAQSKLQLASKHAPFAHILQNNQALREQWVKSISIWLESVDDDFLLQVCEAMNKTTPFRKKLEDEPESEESKKFLKLFEQVPPLPRLTLFQGQSSIWEPVYFETLQEGDVFKLASVNSVSTNPDIPFKFIDPNSHLPIYCVYHIVSKNIKGLPIAQIYREVNRRCDEGKPLKQVPHLMYVGEEEILLPPNLIYSIKSINPHFTYFRYYTFEGYSSTAKLDECLSKTATECGRVKVYQVDLFSSQDVGSEIKTLEVFKNKTYT